MSTYVSLVTKQNFKNATDMLFHEIQSMNIYIFILNTVSSGSSNYSKQHKPITSSYLSQTQLFF